MKRNDPRYAWVRNTWDETMSEGISAWQDIDAHVNAGAGRRDNGSNA
jgi:hypothetical protein